MRIGYRQLRQRLGEALSGAYLIHGEEPLLQRLARDQVAKAAAAGGYAERLRVTVERGFDWQALAGEVDSPGLFARQRLLELWVGSGKLGATGGQLLAQWLRGGSPDWLFLVVGDKFDRRVQESPWFQAVADQGTVVRVEPLKGAALRDWVVEALAEQDRTITPEAAMLLAELVEGNAQAAAQEVAKLALLCDAGTRIERETLLTAVADSARYSAFDLADAAVAADRPRYCRVLAGLRQEGIDPLAIVGALAWRLRDGGGRRGRPGALGSRGQQGLLARLQLVDRRVKGMAPGDPWQTLLDLGMRWCALRGR